MSVSPDGRRCTLKRCVSKRIDKEGMSESQTYDYSELYDFETELVYRNGAWRKVVKQIRYTKAFSAQLEKWHDEGIFHKYNEERRECFKDGDIVLVEGKTEIVYEYPKINIIFGIQQEFYDYTK
jgi:hypothetical protein